jgi:hypothetical protein
MESGPAASLVSLLHVPRWPAWMVTAAPRCADAGTATMRFHGASLTFIPCDATGDLLAMQQGVVARLSTLYAAGTPIGGAVRYLLERVPADVTWSSVDTTHAVAWPLAGDPETVATDPGAQAAALSLAQVPGADALRTVRRAFPADVSSEGAPVLGAAGARYRLFVRDAIPLEDASGKVQLGP